MSDKHSPTLQKIKANRGTIFLITAFIIATILAITVRLISEQRDSNSYSISNEGANGTRALAHILTRHGVRIKTITSLSELNIIDNNSTVIVFRQHLFDDDAFAQIINSRANLIFSDIYLDSKRFSPWVETSANSIGSNNRAKCDFLPAKQAQSLSSLRGSFLPRKSYKHACFSTDSKEYGYVQVIDKAREIHFLADPSIFTNSNLAKDGNAAFALGLLGSNRQLYWLVPPLKNTDSLQNPESNTPPFFWAIMMFTVTGALFFSLAKGRRLGPLLASRNLVVVPSSEAVRGRGALWAKTRSNRAALEAIRKHQQERICSLLGLPSYTSTKVFISKVTQVTDLPNDYVAEAFIHAQGVSYSQMNQIVNAIDVITKTVERQVHYHG